MVWEDRVRVTAARKPSLLTQPWFVRLAGNAPACLRAAIFQGSSVLGAMLLALTALTTAALLLFRFVDPPMSTLMLGQRLTGQAIDQRWVPLKQISPNLVRAVITSEDGQFCEHNGIDFRALALALEEAKRTGEVRGASTISMQVAKNLFLWPSRDLLRKGLELWITVSMELLWPKQRIIEVYLNIAEWGPGVFGAEAAARYHFNKPAARLTARESALLAASLPNPIVRVAGKPGPGTRRLAQTVQARAVSAGPRSACVLGRIAAR